jgi:flavodoxin
MKISLLTDKSNLSNNLNMDICIVFSSIGGHTEMVVDKISELLSIKENIVKKVRVDVTNPASLLKFDLIILASPTYNQGTVEDKFFPFLKVLSTLDLSGKRFAVIGLGSLKYYSEYLTEAATILEECVKTSGGELVVNGLRINGHPAQFTSSLIPSWTNKLILKLESYGV